MSLPRVAGGERGSILRFVDLHVYRLTDDLVPVVVISDGPLPPSPRPPTSVRVLIGVYEHIDDARAAALWARDREPAIARPPSGEAAARHGE